MHTRKYNKYNVDSNIYDFEFNEGGFAVLNGYAINIFTANKSYFIEFQ